VRSRHNSVTLPVVMLGWINDCIEKLVIDKLGVEAWHKIKQKAQCEVEDGGFLKLEAYSDKSTILLAEAVSEVSGQSLADTWELVGRFFIHYVCHEGHNNLISCQGSNLKDWMTNINAIHEHLQSTFPKKMTIPQFWCEDGSAEDGIKDGSLLLHYYSQRGNIFAPVAKGLITEAATFLFQLDIVMDLVQTQGIDGASFTT